METDIVFGIATATAVILIAYQIARVLRTMILHRTIRKGIEHDSAVASELLANIEQDKGASGLGDDRIGLVLIAIGLATFCFGAIQGDSEDIRNLASIAVFPLFVGLVLFGRWFVMRRRPGAEG